MFLWNILLFFGLVYELINIRWVLPVWMVVLLAIPREGGWLVSIPIAILAGIGGADVLYPLITNLTKTKLQKITANAMVVVLVFLLLGSAHATLWEMVAEDDALLSPDTMDAMGWIAQNTPLESNFIVISSLNVIEWTPQIARRTVLNTPFGAEWEPQEMKQIQAFNSRIDECSTIECVHQSIKDVFGYDETHVLIDNDYLAKIQANKCTGNVEFGLIWQNSSFSVGSFTL